MLGASGPTPTSLRCRRGPGEWRGCPASGGLGAWRNHSEYRHSQRLSFRIVTDAARVVPASSMVPEGGADQPPDGPKRVPVYACRWSPTTRPRRHSQRAYDTPRGPLVPFEFNHHQRAIRDQGHQIDAPPSARYLLTNHQLLAREDGAGEGPCPLLPLSLTDPDAMAEGPHFHARRCEWGGGQRPGDVVLYMVYQPLTGGPYRRRIRRCQSRWLFFVRQPAHVL